MLNKDLKVKKSKLKGVKSETIQNDNRTCPSRPGMNHVRLRADDNWGKCGDTRVRSESLGQRETDRGHDTGGITN
jgi:hypothetical protein